MKKAIMILVLMFITVCAFSQTLDWQWVNQAGGSLNDISREITNDTEGNLFISGDFRGTSTFGSTNLSSEGLYDIFVTKMDSTGNFLWAKRAGGIGGTYCSGMTSDNNGNVYITGCFEETAYFDSLELVSVDGYDIFVAKMDSTGNWLWATRAGGIDYETGKDITLDNLGNVYITGNFRESATFDFHYLNSNGFDDIFVAKMDSTGCWLWAKAAGNEDTDYGSGITIDSLGNIYVAGYFYSNFVNFDSVNILNNGGSDIFVAKMDSTGNWLWATGAGGYEYDFEYGIDSDTYGNIYITGYFDNAASFGDFNLVSNGTYDIYVAKLSEDGNWLYAKKAGGNGIDHVNNIFTDLDGNSHITGCFENIAYFDSSYIVSNGQYDIFFATIDFGGNWLSVNSAGSISNDYGKDVTANNESLYITGCFEDTANFGNFSLISSGFEDIFIAKFGHETSKSSNILFYQDNTLKNHPNPFNPSTTIKFSIQKDSRIELSIYNIKGQKINTLANNELIKGNHSLIWNGDDESGEPVSSGVYLYKLNANDKTKAVKKCLLLK